MATGGYKTYDQSAGIKLKEINDSLCEVRKLLAVVISNQETQIQQLNSIISNQELLLDNDQTKINLMQESLQGQLDSNEKFDMMMTNQDSVLVKLDTIISNQTTP